MNKLKLAFLASLPTAQGIRLKVYRHTFQIKNCQKCIMNAIIITCLSRVYFAFFANFMKNLLEKDFDYWLSVQINR